MIKVDSKIKMDWAKIDQLTSATSKALEQTAEAVHTKVVQAQVVPRDTGNLQNEAFFVDTSQSSDGVVSLVHSAPYARRLYFHPEFKFSKRENPNAQAYWFEDWMEGGSKEAYAANAFKIIYRRLTGV